MNEVNSGFIVLWRRFGETSFFKDSYAVHLAVHLLLKANHEPKTFTFNRKQEIVDRGQLITGRKALAFETGIHESTVRHKLELLQNVGFLTIQSNNRFSMITICKYSDYQDKKRRKDQPVDQRSTNEVPTKYQPSTTNNNVNNVNNVNNENKDVYKTAPTPKKLYREFVRLEEKEYADLCAYIGEANTMSMIDRLNDYIGANGKKYQSHYHVIRGWWRRDHPDERPERKL